MVTPKFHACQSDNAKNTKKTNKNRRFGDYVNSNFAKMGNLQNYCITNSARWAGASLKVI